MEHQNLYERLGGVNAIAMVVDRFSDAIIENPKRQKNSALKEWNESGQLAGLRFMRTLWLCQEAGAVHMRHERAGRKALSVGECAERMGGHAAFVSLAYSR